jgi:hypothetical protein
MFQIVDKIFLKKFSTTSKFNHNEFSQLKTNFDRFKYVWDYQDKLLDTEYTQFIDSKIAEINNNAETKDLEIALKYREEGNALYKKNSLYDALGKYNLSLKYSPIVEIIDENGIGNNIALTYSNRSAVFLALKKYQLCLNDIEQAFINKYPKSSWNRLVDRKIECLIKLNRKSEAYSYLKSILTNDREYYSEDIQKGYEEKLSKLESSDTTHIEEMLNELNIDNSAYKIDYSEDFGNYIKSTKDTELGDQVLVETPYASVLLKEFISTNCYECMKRLNANEMNITFCKYCVNVTYCSDSCCKFSWESHHSYECKYLRLIIYKFGISHMEHLALRIILKTNYEYLNSIKDELASVELKDKETCEIDSKKPYNSNGYKNIFNLITHSNKRISSDLIRRAMVAGLFGKIIIKTSYFSSDVNVNSDEFYYICGLILRHLQSISCNAHEINEFQYNTHSVATSITTGIGAGIYATLSLFNHSCNPHVVRNFVGTSCVLRSIRCIKEGEQIYDNYGKLYAINNYDDRQFKLEDQYFFNCKCEPCMSKWPTYDDINNDLSKLKYWCEVCHKTTDQVKNDPGDCCLKFLDKLKNIKTRIEKDRKYCKRALKDLLEAKTEEKMRLKDATEKFVRYLSNIDTYVATKPFQDFNDCQEALKQCFNMLGNKYEFTKID